jgi:N-hydroxyarylamine O-acetyltransferase
MSLITVDGFVDSYLRRLGVAGARAGGGPDPGLLRELQAAHLERVPFENLSIHLGEPLSLEPDALADKILARGRGGFCYELNGLFGRLLESLGYRVTRLGAQVWTGETFGPPLDHLALVVSADDDGEERWLADVGFGDHSVYPLPWQAGTDIEDPGGVFRLEPAANGDLDVYRDGKPQYRLDPHPRALADFEAMCWYQSHAPPFPLHPLASLQPPYSGRARDAQRASTAHYDGGRAGRARTW